MIRFLCCTDSQSETSLEWHNRPMTAKQPAHIASAPHRTGRPPLGGLSIARFMRDYWQRQPLLIRGAVSVDEMRLLPDQALLPERLFTLAGEDEVESRLVQRRGDDWTLEHGPFAQLPGVPRSRNSTATNRSWTLLVQGVNLHEDRADALLRRFAFISQARLDDLMISYATDGGGVGPHVDSYDVFLLQTLGRRRWRISAQSDVDLVDGAPLRILADFRAEQEWILEPGDMLYLPPRYAHEGTAIGPCMTCSIGFRAPAYNDLAREFLFEFAETLNVPGLYCDAGRRAARASARIDDHLVDALAQRLSAIKWSRSDIADFLASHLSEPKPTVFFDAPARRLSLAQFRTQALRKGVRLHRKTSMLYSATTVFINGEAVPQVAAQARPALQKLANDRRLQAGECVLWLQQDGLLDCLSAWHDDGWLEIDVAA